MANNKECNDLYYEIKELNDGKIKNGLLSEWNLNTYYAKNNIPQEQLDSIKIINIGTRNLNYYGIEEYKNEINKFIQKLNEYQTKCTYKSNIRPEQI